jgi:(4S)-4-hydroxy-5-phosphonooxypentane-2,3-dione isomerase
MSAFVVIVDLLLKPESRERCLALIQENAAASRRLEKGCRRFDVCVPRDGSPRVFLYEIYDDEAAFKAHQETPHFKSFIAASDPYIQERRIGALDLLGAS